MISSLKSQISSLLLLLCLCGCIPNTTSSGRVIRISHEERDVSLLLRERDNSLLPADHTQHYTGNNLACPALDRVSAGDSVHIAYIPYHNGTRWIRNIAILDTTNH